MEPTIPLSHSVPASASEPTKASIPFPFHRENVGTAAQEEKRGSGK